MGTLFSRNKNDGKRRTFKFWGSSHNQLNSTKTTNKTLPITPQQNQQWTDISLESPSSSSFLDKLEKEVILTAPIPPPRKHKNKMKNTLTEEIQVEKATKIHAVDSMSPDKLIPVEEAIIIPKKEPIHICDGKHHHVRNIVNGKIIHDTIITGKSNEVTKIQNITKEPQIEKKSKPSEQTPKKEEKVLVRPKNLSTVSLPNFDELNEKTMKSHITKEMKKKPKRHISVVSLPTDKTTPSDITMARLQNYVMRCKSFGKLLPTELLEKLQTHLEFSSDSEDSWDGVDDWDMEIIEHTGVKQSPLVPRSYIKINADKTSSTVTPSAVTPSNATPSTITTHNYNDIRVPTPIEEDQSDEEMVAPVEHGIITLKKREGRRESIDDFFDSSGENPLAKALPIKKVNYLGRRGSDGFFGYNKANLLKDLSLKMINSEKSDINDLARRRKSAAAVLHRIDSTEYNEDEDEDGIESRKDSVISEECLSTSEEDSKHSKRNSTPDNDDFVLVHKDNNSSSSTIEPEATEHSNLLKFLTSNALTDKKDVKENL